MRWAPSTSVRGQLARRPRLASFPSSARRSRTGPGGARRAGATLGSPAAQRRQLWRPRAPRPARTAPARTAQVDSNPRLTRELPVSPLPMPPVDGSSRRKPPAGACPVRAGQVVQPTAGPGTRSASTAASLASGRLSGHETPARRAGRSRRIEGSQGPRSAATTARLEHGQVAVELPLRDLDAVLVPLACA